METEMSEHYSVTMAHINRVREIMWSFIRELDERAQKHDASKLESPEKEGFAAHNARLKTLTYPSPEWDDSLKQLEPTLEEHYARNRHHPQHWENGIEDMDIVDLMEMLVDWMAASERCRAGNVHKIIATNIERFKLSPQLVKILENTVDRYT